MLLSLVVAASENNVIGKDNKLPWHLSDDLKRFKALTRGKAVIMGRKTFESIGHALPDRRNIVVSRRLEVAPAGCELANSLSMAIDMAMTQKADEVDSPDEMFLIGGAALFATGIDLADRLYLTRVHATIDGDVLLPEIDFGKWKEIAREEHLKDSEYPYAFTFVDYERVR